MIFILSISLTAVLILIFFVFRKKRSGLPKMINGEKYNSDRYRYDAWDDDEEDDNDYL